MTSERMGSNRKRRRAALAARVQKGVKLAFSPFRKPDFESDAFNHGFWKVANHFCDVAIYPAKVNALPVDVAIQRAKANGLLVGVNGHPAKYNEWRANLNGERVDLRALGVGVNGWPVDVHGQAVGTHG